MSDLNDKNIAEIFGEDVFNDNTMKKWLPEKTYKKFHETLETGKPLDNETAKVIAGAMKDWAVSKGATHFTHWFQPLTGATAEKHDAFISVPDEGGSVSLEFSGKELIKGESDASSFPSGGLRATFEARGYTVWDLSSPAYVRRGAGGATLCIPTAFCSYTGEALDQKTPLLRSMQAINEQGLRLIRLFGNKTAKRVIPMVGPEQEYFLVDKKKFLERKDLVYTGRTLFGAKPPKGQELDDHYFGSIRERVAAFMKDVNAELWALGVAARTQHNEAAPAQHELAPIYAICNVAVDNNQLMMEVLKKVADRHGLACLLHEKPFEGVNGSGKHNNWSLVTDDGENLFDPGKVPHENKQFLLILTCIMKAIDKHAALLRESASDPGNDCRLGGNEAPPSVISVFLGSQLDDVLRQFVKKGEATHSLSGGSLMTDIKMIPNLHQDATDRNRTSPIAFTGNKFEFRMPGSKDSVAPANVVLNTIAAEAFCEAADELEKAENFDEAVQEIIIRNAKAHSRIIFNGNGYSASWLEEALRRGLPVVSSMVEATGALLSESSVKVFEKFRVFTKTELESRADIKYENYSKAVNIEAQTMLHMAGKDIIPCVMKYAGELGSAAAGIISVGGDATVITSKLNRVTELLNEAQKAMEWLQDTDTAANTMGRTIKEQAVFFHDTVCPAMAALRKPVDELELLVDRKSWPMPSYGDLIFEV